MNFDIGESTIVISTEDASAEGAHECAKEIYGKVGVNNVIVVTDVTIGKNDKLSKVVQKFVQSFKDKIVVWDIKTEKLGDYLKLRYCAECMGFSDLSFVFDNGNNEKLYLLMNEKGEELYRRLMIYAVGVTAADSLDDSNAELLTSTIFQHALVRKKLKKALRHHDKAENLNSF